MQNRPAPIRNRPSATATRRPDFRQVQVHRRAENHDRYRQRYEGECRRQRAVAQDQLHVLHCHEEESEVGEEEERDADRSGGEVGPTEQAYIQQRIATPQLNHREGRPEHDAGHHASPDDRVRPAACGRFHDAEHEYRKGGADQYGADPVQRCGGLVARRPDRARGDEQGDARRGERRRRSTARKRSAAEARCPESRRSHWNSRRRPRCQRPCCARSSGRRWSTATRSPA